MLGFMTAIRKKEYFFPLSGASEIITDKGDKDEQAKPYAYKQGLY